MQQLEAYDTERLKAEQLRASHYIDFCHMHQDPIVMATLGGVRTTEQTQQFLHTNLTHWDRYGFGLWIFRDRTTGQFVGRGGLRHVDIDGDDEIELAYALMARYWGRGLATEMARASLLVGFEQLGLTQLVCWTHKSNRPSQRVMEKAGFHFEREVIYKAQPHMLYRLTACDWHKQRTE